MSGVADPGTVEALRDEVADLRRALHSLRGGVIELVDGDRRTIIKAGSVEVRTGPYWAAIDGGLDGVSIHAGYDEGSDTPASVTLYVGDYGSEDGIRFGRLEVQTGCDADVWAIEAGTDRSRRSDGFVAARK